jgi:hypothetical protein
MSQEKRETGRKNNEKQKAASNGLEALGAPVTTDVSAEMLRRIVRKLEGKSE